MANDFTRRISESFVENPEADIRNVEGAPGWVELVTADPDAACAFLSATLGWRFRRLDIPDVDYRLGLAHGQPVGGVLQMPPEGPQSPQWNTYFAVADLDEAVAAAEQAGGTLRFPKTAVPGIGRFAGVTHPSGGQVMLGEYEKPMGTIF